MKKIVLLVIALSNFAQAQLNNRRLVVPEFGSNTGNNKIKTYVPTTGGSMVEDPTFTINLSSLGALSTSASPNCVAMYGSDLYVSLTWANQRVYKFPNYGQAPASAIANVSQLTNLSSEYVGIAFDVNGNLYTSEGVGYGDTQLVKYSGAGLATRTVLGNGGLTSYFANITFDGTGNLWASDYKNNRIVCIPNSGLVANATIKSLINATAPMNATGSSLGNTNATLSASAVNYAFTSPEGVAFDSTGALWVANNNDGGSNGNLVNSGYTTLVRISPALQASVIAGTTTTITNALLTSTSGLKIWNVPNSASGRSQLGGMQIDKATDRIYVTEQKSNAGLFFDISGINAITTTHATYKLPIFTTNPGNGGLYLATNTQVLGIEDMAQAENTTEMYPNPCNGEFKIEALLPIKNVIAFDVLGKQVALQTNTENYTILNATPGIYYIKIMDENGKQSTKKLIVNN